jgi:hypothetical protein
MFELWHRNFLETSEVSNLVRQPLGAVSLHEGAE